jgi:hypothetical protein
MRDWLLTKTGFRRRVRRRYRSDDKSILVSFPQKIESIVVLMKTVRRKWWYITRIVSRMTTVNMLTDGDSGWLSGELDGDSACCFLRRYEVDF